MTQFEEIATRCGVYPGGGLTMDALLAMIGELERRILQLETKPLLPMVVQSSREGRPFVKLGTAQSDTSQTAKRFTGL